MRTKATNRFTAILGVAALGTLGLGAAEARDQGNYAQAEWAQDYASPAGMQVQR